MIALRNSQRKIKVEVKRIVSTIKKMLKIIGYEEYDVGVWLTTNRTIRKYNMQFRKKDKPTDILSFPYHTELQPGERICIHEPEDKNLGDIIISLEFAKKDAIAQNRSLMAHINILLAHGIAHLVGYDHQTEKQFMQMQRMEKKLLRAL